MSRPFDIITFDCYGTLVDWRAGISNSIVHAGRQAGVELDPAAVLQLHVEIEREIERGPYLPYRDVLGAVVKEIGARFGWTPPETDLLASNLPNWPVFPDTNPALTRLKAQGYRLGILSNVDNDLLAGTRRHINVEFDLIVTAEDVRSYKPAKAHFATARQLIGGVRWLHAAQSYYHDIQPAYRMGVASIWINRLDEALGGDERPHGIVSDLHGLVDWLRSPPPREPVFGGKPQSYMKRDS